MSDTGELKITDTTGAILLQKSLQWVEDITIKNDKFTLNYNNGTSKELELIANQIEEVAMPTEGDYIYHLLILFTAESKKGDISYNGKEGWTDLGIIKDYNGILMGMNIDSTSNPDWDNPANALEHLKSTYPNGITEGYAAGKVVTVGSPNNTKRFYAYDYVNNEWIYLGDTSGTADIHSVIAGPDDASTQQAAAALPTGSLWFVIEEE